MTFSANHCLISLILIVLAIPTITRGESATPNILLILADDLAWSDLGCFKNGPSQSGVNDFNVNLTRPNSAMRVGRHKEFSFDEDQRCEVDDFDTDLGGQTDLSQGDPQLEAKVRERLRRTLVELNASAALQR